MNTDSIFPPDSALRRLLTIPIIGIGILVLAITVTIIYVITDEVIETTVSNSDVYQLAIHQIQSNADVQLALGKPLSFGRPRSIVIFTNVDHTGQADFTIPIYGAQSSANARVIAEKVNGNWQFKRLRLTIEGHPSQIDLATSAQ
jgi:hypothetical protein